MKQLTKYIVGISVFFTFNALSGQKTAVYLENNYIYQEGIRAFDEGQYSLAGLKLDRFKSALESSNRTTHLSGIHADVYRVKMAYDLGLENADDILLELERNYPGHILLQQAYLAKANYYFRIKDYTEALNSFSVIKANLLNREESQTVWFKMAYSNFVKQRFDQAAPLLEDLTFTKNEYYFPANYYLGICEFLRGNFTESIHHFEIVQNDPYYRDHIPYYLVQLYFTQEQYQKTITYGEERLQVSELKNRHKIHQLIGSAYFIQGDYAKALPHLETFEKQVEKMTEADFYQLAYAYYFLEKWKEAIPHFLQISDVEGDMGQVSNYYLANCYLKTGDKLSARTALKKVTDHNIKNNMHEESLLNFGKLSAELGYDREAIDALFLIPDNSLYYIESQNLLGELFVQTRDYSKAQEILESRNNVSYQLFDAYQKVCYYKALQEIQNGREDVAISDLEKAIKTDRDLSTTLQAYYWLAEILQRQGKYAQSSENLIKYFLLIKGVPELTGQSAPAFAHYLQGYNYIQLNKYQAGYDEFSRSLTLLPRTTLDNVELKNKIYLNAKLRAGDCALQLKKFSDALYHYDDIIKSRNQFTPYAMYQKAIILQLNGDNGGAITLLQGIMRDYTSSDMLEQTYLLAGDIYLETGQQDKAMETFKSMVNLPDDRGMNKNRAYLKLGLLHYNKGQLDEASNMYQSVLTGNPSGSDAKEALRAMEEIYIKDLNQPAEFIQIVRNKAGMEMENYYADSVTYAAARNLYDKAQFTSAVKGFSEYLNTFPKGYFNVESHFYRGKSLLATEKYRDALEDFRFILEKGAGEFYEESLFNAAMICFNYSNDFRQAYKYYTELESLTSSEPRKYEAQLGALRSAYRNAHLDGVNIFAAKIQSNPLATVKETTSSYYYLGKLNFQEKKYDPAINAFNKVIQNMKNSSLAAEARYLIALIYYERKEYKLAEELCRNANSINNAYPYWIAKTLLLLSDLLVIKNDLFNAKSAVDAVIQNYRDDARILAEAEDKLKQIAKLQVQKSRLEKKNLDGTLIMDFNN